VVKPLTTGQAARLLGISEGELAKIIKELKEKLGRSKVTYLELGMATGLSQQQIYRSLGWLYKDFGIEIIKEQEKAGVIREMERKKATKARLAELQAQLDQIAEQREWAENQYAKYKAELEPLEKELKRLGVGWDQKINEEMTMIYKKYDMAKVYEILDKVEEIEERIRNVKRQSSS